MFFLGYPHSLHTLAENHSEDESRGTSRSCVCSKTGHTVDSLGMNHISLAASHCQLSIPGHREHPQPWISAQGGSKVKAGGREHQDPGSNMLVLTLISSWQLWSLCSWVFLVRIGDVKAVLVKACCCPFNCKEVGNYSCAKRFSAKSKSSKRSTWVTKIFPSPCSACSFTYKSMFNSANKRNLIQCNP